MREIKFRAWDKKRKEVFPVHELSFNKFDVKPTTVKGYTHDEKDIWNVHGGHFMNYANEDRYVLMQYTGLKDKNGVEIYEGDIMPVNGQVCYVVYHEEYARYCLQMKSGRMFIPSKNSEVIGNIYKNLELLEVAEHG